MKKKYLLFIAIVLLCFSCKTKPIKINRIEIPIPTKEIPEQIYERKGYCLSFNPQENIPNWVAWELNIEKIKGEVPRAKHFYPDPDIPRGIAVETKDYSRSGYDRGHMCPAADNKWDAMAMRESFYMTNICPQNNNLNRGDWKDLEELCRQWVEKKGTLYIVCGPLMEASHPEKYIGKERRIKVPEAFFKVFLCGLENGNPQAYGFIFKNKAGSQSLEKYLYSIDEIEAQTGLDFFSKLNDDIENEIEAEQHSSL